MKKLMIIIIALCFVTGCADTVDLSTASEIAKVGFWHGLWHGITLPFAWIGSLFSDSISIYAVYNNGGWYDFGFILGCGALGGGASSSGGKRK